MAFRPRLYEGARGSAICAGSLDTAFAEPGVPGEATGTFAPLCSPLALQPPLRTVFVATAAGNQPGQCAGRARGGIQALPLAGEMEIGGGGGSETGFWQQGSEAGSGRCEDMSEWPKITLVTAVYNGEEYLEATIRSIVNQEYPDLEYIVVDDGSTDGTAEIIRKYGRGVSCWFSQANQGLYAALNAGFARSTGEIMGWLNASDLLQVNGLFTVGSIFRGLGDFELWARFFRHARLHSVNALIGGYRLHDHALSSSNMERYNRNCDQIAAREVESLQGGKRAAVKAFRWINEVVKPIPKVRGLWHLVAIRSLYGMPGPDWPPVIEYGEESWRLRR